MVKYEGFKIPVSLYDNSHVIFDVRKKELRDMNAREMFIMQYMFKVCEQNEGKASYSEIADKCLVGRSTAIRCIDNLTASGYLIKESTGECNKYSIDMSKF